MANARLISAQLCEVSAPGPRLGPTPPLPATSWSLQMHVPRLGSADSDLQPSQHVSRAPGHAGLRIKENKEVYEGEVTELTPEETENQVGGYGKVISHVIIGLKTVKGLKQLKLDPTIYDSLQKERVQACPLPGLKAWGLGLGFRVQGSGLGFGTGQHCPRCPSKWCAFQCVDFFRPAASDRTRSIALFSTCCPCNLAALGQDCRHLELGA